MYICVVTSRVVPATRKETLRRVAARPPVDGARRSTGSLALLELDGVHGDVAPDQHDGSAGGAEHRGAALGLLVAGEKGVSRVSFRSSRSEKKEKKPALRASRFREAACARAETRGGGGVGGYAPRRCRTSSRRGCTPAVEKEARVGQVSGGTRDASRGTLAKYRQPTEGQSRGRHPVGRGHAPARRRPRAWGRRC